MLYAEPGFTGPFGLKGSAMMNTASQRYDWIELKGLSRPEYVKAARAFIAAVADSTRLPKKAIEDVQVATCEAVTNVVRHAYGDISSPGPITIRFGKGERELVIEVIDAGEGFVPEDNVAYEGPDPNREGGLGIPLIRRLMDGVVYWSEPNVGTRVRMVKSLVRRRRRNDGAQRQDAGPVAVGLPR